MIDKCLIVPILACAYALIVSPLLIHVTSGPANTTSLMAKVQNLMTPRPENKIVWPALAAIAVVLAIRNWSRLTLPPHIKYLFAYLALAGVSVLWAVKPDFSSTRFLLQLTIVTSIVLPALLAGRTVDLMRGVFLCYAFATILNIFFVLNQTPIIYNGNEVIGYPGYFIFKGILGECAAIAFLLALYEILHPGHRRALGIIVIVIAIYLMIASQSKGSLGLALLAPLLAGLTLIIGKKTRVSPAIVLLPIPICYAVLSNVVGNLINRISYMMYGNYTLSGRTFIWDFVNVEIGRRPLLGWGYQSFWLVGADAPSVIDAPGWIKGMPSSHNGYLETMVDTGYLGLALFIVFIFTTLRAIGRIADREPTRAWLVLSLALFVVLVNFLESVWMHGMDMLWLVFLIVVAETARCSRPLHPGFVPEPVLRGPFIAKRRPDFARARSIPGLARYQNRRT
jgi:O-antigen ligase